MKLILAGSGGLVAYLAWRSLGWPLLHDAPLMYYIAWVIGQGGVPYRDVFDMNLPGVYLLHMAILDAAGPSDIAWRLVDLGWLAAIGALLWLYARPAGDLPALCGSVLFALYHLSGGDWRAGQRDYLLCLFLIAGAYGIARSFERDGAPGPSTLAGLALGAGMTIKPHAGLYWLAGAAIVAWGAWRAKRSAVKAAAGMLLGGLVFPALVFGWLAWRGGLGPFVDVFTGYVIPLYSRVGRVAVWRSIPGYRHGVSSWALMGLLAAIALARPMPGAARPRRVVGARPRQVVAAVGVLCGALHFALQAKGWEYQTYPLMLFLCALVPFAVARVAPAARPGRPSYEGAACARPDVCPRAGALSRLVDRAGPALFWPSAALSRAGALAQSGALARLAALGALAALVAVLGTKGVEALDAPWIADKARRVDAVTRDLARIMPDGATVQVMDVTEGGIHALWKLGRRQPTRFIYDFHFFHNEDDPRIRALRREFVAALAAAPPADIVIFRDTWNRHGYERISDWPALAAFIDHAYVLAVEGDAYRIYAKRPGS